MHPQIAQIDRKHYSYIDAIESGVSHAQAALVLCYAFSEHF